MSLTELNNNCNAFYLKTFKSDVSHILPLETFYYISVNYVTAYHIAINRQNAIDRRIYEGDFVIDSSALLTIHIRVRWSRLTAHVS